MSCRRVRSFALSTRTRTQAPCCRSHYSARFAHSNPCRLLWILQPLVVACRPPFVMSDCPLRQPHRRTFETRPPAGSFPPEPAVDRRRNQRQQSANKRPSELGPGGSDCSFPTTSSDHQSVDEYSGDEINPKARWASPQRWKRSVIRVRFSGDQDTKLLRNRELENGSCSPRSGTPRS